MWVEICNLDHLPTFSGFAAHVAAELAAYKAVFDSNDAHEVPLAEPWSVQLTSFQKLLFLR